MPKKTHSSNKQLLQKLSKLVRSSRRRVLIIIFVLVGIATLLITHAATSTATSIEVENGSSSTGSISSSSASGGKYVKFAAANTSALAVKVSGDHFVNQTGATVQLRGVNYSGTEYGCWQTNDIAGYATDPYLHGNGGIHESAMLDYADGANNFNGGVAGVGEGIAQNFLKWDKAGTPVNGSHAINTVRIPINEACWLNTNNVPANTLGIAFTGANYQTFIKRLVDKLTAQNMYVILDDHRSAPGTNFANQQNVGPNADHTPTFWSQVATTYKNYPNVLFDLFNEPGVGCPGISGCTSSNQQQRAWDVYLDGGTYTYQANDNGNDNNSHTGQSFQIAGIKGIISTNIRGSGANNPVIIETLGWGSGFMETMGDRIAGIDPLTTTSTGSQLVASFHQYHHWDGANVGGDWDGTLSHTLAGRYPIFVGEYSYENEAFDPAWATNTLAWIDSRNYSHTAWSWDANQTINNTLVTYPRGNDTAETSQFGALVKSNLQSHQP